MYYGTPPIVTNGLVLNLDAANSLSIPIDPTFNRAQSPLNFTSNYATTLTASNNTTTNYDGTLTAGTISTSTPAYYARTGGVSPALTYSKQYAVSWLLKYSNLSTIRLEWGGAHTGNRTNLTFNLQTSDITSVTQSSGENYGSYNLGNGWYQVWYTSTTTGSGTNNFFPQLSLSSSGSCFIGGIQIEMNNYATPFTTSSRTSWGNLSNLSTTASLLTASFSSSIPSYRSLNQRILNFDGTGSYATITSPWSYLSSSATEVFFSANSFGSSINTPLAGYDQNDNSSFSFSVAGMIYITNSDRKIRSSVITATQVYREVASTTIIQPGKYYHVVLNKDTTNGVLDLYVNGILEATNTFDTGSYAQWTTLGTFRGSNIIQLSNTLSSNTSFNSRYLNGTIPTFRLYNRILSQQEITQNYNALKSRFGLQ
jgi:hypothetical protein